MRRHQARRARRLPPRWPGGPILVYAPGAVRSSSSGAFVEMTQVAPTILRLLGLDPAALKAMQIEDTQTLPGIEKGRDHR